MSVSSEDFTIVDEQPTGMTAITEPAGQKDEVYYWADNITLSVHLILSSHLLGAGR